MKTAILGCGPAGLFAAHAASLMGDEVTIFSKAARKSFMRGAQYLHRPIPELSGEPFTIDYRLTGSVRGYREKVYGPSSDVTVSPEVLVGESQAWDIREAYDAAWDRYRPRIFDYNLEGDTGTKINRLLESFDDVISTVPAWIICLKPDVHSFLSTTIWSTNFVKKAGIFADPKLDNVVLCSGEPKDWWYRASRIHGWENTEYPMQVDMTRLRLRGDDELGGIWKVEKPVSTDCDCWEHEVQKLGRYGGWQKGALSHEAFYDLVEATA